MKILWHMHLTLAASFYQFRKLKILSGYTRLQREHCSPVLRVLGLPEERAPPEGGAILKLRAPLGPNRVIQAEAYWRQDGKENRICIREFAEH
jgi:hypothetical protein